MMFRPLCLDHDPAKIAETLRDQYGPYRAWIVATHQADHAAAGGDTELADRWRRIASALDRLGERAKPAR